MFNLFSNPLSRKVNRALIVSNNLPLRRIKLHEYQAGKLLHTYKVQIPLGNVAFNSKEAHLVATSIMNEKNVELVVKA